MTRYKCVQKVKKMNIRNLTIIPFAFLVAGCVTTNSDMTPTYSNAAVGTVQRTLYGTIVSAQPVKVSGNSLVSTGVGGVVGGTTGALIGGSNNRLLGATVGTAVGALGGKLIGDKAAPKELLQYQVRLDSGEVYSMIQPKGLMINQRVMVVLPNGQNPGKLTPCM